MHRDLLAELAAIRARGPADDSVRRVRHLLEEEGVTTAGGFADFLLELVESERQAGAISKPEQLDVSADDRCDPNLRIVHRRPRGQFYWRGTAMEPRDIDRFNGTPLHFTFVGERKDTRLVAAGSHREIRHLLQRQALIGEIRGEVRHDVQSYLSPAGALVPAEGSVGSAGISVQFEPAQPSPSPEGEGGSGGYVTCGTTPPRPTAEAQFFQHGHFDTDGHWFWLAPGWQIPRLTDWRLSHAILAGSESWNDRISSIKSGDGMLVAYEAIDFVGSSLTLLGSVPKLRSGTHPICMTPYWVFAPPRQDIPDLGTLGWNDRISSLRHYAGPE